MGIAHGVRITAKADYAVRATAELAAAGPDRMLKAEDVSRSQDIPPKFLPNILVELKHAGLVRSQRGAEGGYALASPASSITIADVIRAVEGPLATVQDIRPENLRYSGAASELQAVWVAVRSSLRSVLEEVTLADLVRGSLPDRVLRLAHKPDAWISRKAGLTAIPRAVTRSRRDSMSRSESGRLPHAPSGHRP
jgi:Rrf2 family protein